MEDGPVAYGNTFKGGVEAVKFAEEVAQENREALSEVSIYCEVPRKTIKRLDDVFSEERTFFFQSKERPDQWLDSLDFLTQLDPIKSVSSLFRKYKVYKKTVPIERFQGREPWVANTKGDVKGYRSYLRRKRGRALERLFHHFDQKRK